MYRLLIVDDEPAITEGLGQLFREQMPELDVCQAYSAIEALSWIKRAKVDIIISDIRMPEKNGLQLIDELTHYWPSCKVIFLTGYDEFDYVYSAIRKNAAFYILKTEDDTELLNAVSACIRQLEEEAGQISLLEAARNQMLLMGLLYQNQFLEATLYGENVKELAVEAGNGTAEIGTRLSFRNPVLLLVCRVGHWRKDVSYGHKLQTYYSIQHAVEERLAKSIIRESLVFEHELIVWFLQPDSAESKFIGEDGGMDWRGLSAYTSSVLESVQQDCEEGERNLIFVMARQAVAWEEVHREFDVLRLFLKRRLLPDRQSAAVVDLGAPDGKGTKSLETRHASMGEFRRRLRELEKSLDGEAEPRLERICRDLLKEIRERLDVHYLTGMEMYYNFLLIFLGAMDSLELEQVAMTDIPSDWEAASERFVELGRRICAEKLQRSSHEGDALIRRLQSYVRENLHEDLSLVRMGEVTYFNPSYLSRLYKQHTGMNFSDFVQAERLEAAKRLLGQPAMKANDIAEQLGFSSPSYFSTFFRKMTGRSPQEYRDDLIVSERLSRK